jgi:elongation factor 1-beta
MADHYILGIFEVLPDDVDTDLEELVKKVQAAISVPDVNSNIEMYRVEPVAFGLNKLIIRIQMPENIQGGTQPVEDAIAALPEVQRTECTMVSRQ